MTKVLEKFLKHIAQFQYNHHILILIVVSIFTIFMFIGISKVEFQGDMSEDNPNQLAIYQLNDKITEKFGGQDNILVVITLDDSFDFKDLPRDIRDPDIIAYITKLQRSLSLESSISSVVSIGSYFQGYENIHEEDVDEVFDSYPLAEEFVSNDYDATYVLISSDIGSGEDKVREITGLVQDKLDSFSKPPGTKYAITGNPPVEVTITSLLIKDAKYTIMLACIFIFIFLLVVEGGFIRSILIFIPLILGLSWTIGTMGWLGIKISMVTAGLGAMLLGLGVEYGVFMLKRYEEERAKDKSIMESLIVSVPGVGSAILGSGLTTTIGFGALMFSILPMLAKLGMSLAIGIIFTFMSAVFVAPIVFIITEKLIKYFDKRLYLLFKKHLSKRTPESI
ncbi:MMPL family transporter [Candidatus Woesearchaeota archaeon]|nr:MMPL family transporter [Candidatus Woesearchaeota archaeon]